MKKQDKGFTLVELLIVIVILGILATVTVFAVRGITQTGQENACGIEARTLDSAIEAYYAQVGSDPTLETQLVPDYLRDAPDDANWLFVPAGDAVPASLGADLAVGGTGLDADRAAIAVGDGGSPTSAYYSLEDGACAGH